MPSDAASRSRRSRYTGSACISSKTGTTGYRSPWRHTRKCSASGSVSAIFARASWAFSFDNITEIPDWLSNSLCKGVTGDAVLQRALHSDEDIMVFSFQRVIAMTTIALDHDLAADLADRMLLVEPDVLTTHLTEQQVRAALAAALPAALGAILGLVAGVVRQLPQVSVDSPPRMADFARVLAALDQVTGWDALTAYRAKVTAMSLSLIEGSTLARALYRLATTPSPGGPPPTRWEGTAAELLQTLRHTCQAADLPTTELPAGERMLGQKVREIAPALRRTGVNIHNGWRTHDPVLDLLAARRGGGVVGSAR